jgi:hypothetical protein
METVAIQEIKVYKDLRVEKEIQVLMETVVA